MDEAWSVLQYREGGAFLAGLARRARKYYLGLVTISQSVTDFLGSDAGRAVLANAAVKLLLKQDGATIDAVEEAFRLSSGERQFLLGAAKGEGLLCARGVRLALAIEASPAEHELATTAPAELAARQTSAGGRDDPAPADRGGAARRRPVLSSPTEAASAHETTPERRSPQPAYATGGGPSAGASTAASSARSEGGAR